MERMFFASGAISAFIAVAAGAFGAHALKNVLAPDMLAVYETSVRYQLVHAFALISSSWALTRWPGRLVNIAGGLFIAGTVFFCGSLYALSLSGVRWLGAVTPLGGVMFLAAWFLLALAALRGR